MTGEQLEAIGARNFKDYLNGLPGVQFHASTPGVSNVTLRGIGTATIYPDQGQATTGIYINDIPLTDPGFALSVPDLDVFDVQRVEVLRGPGNAVWRRFTGRGGQLRLQPRLLTELQPASRAGLRHHQQLRPGVLRSRNTQRADCRGQDRTPGGDDE
jgi:outer membrane receptor for monomeric catechols